MGLVWPLLDNSIRIIQEPGACQPFIDLCRESLYNAGRLSDNAKFHLVFSSEGVSLLHAEGKESPLFVDFAAGAVDHRRKFGGGKNQDIAKAVGLNKGFYPRVLDATAGLGRDAFVLASLGCQMVLQERSPIVYALLADGLLRAGKDADVAEIARRISLSFGSSLETMAQEGDEPIDVIYLDPMFPERNKSALVKKDMRFFHAVVGDDPDSDQLLTKAMTIDCARVVVKRPAKAEFLDGCKPSHQIIGKSIRYDVYVKRKLTSA